MQYINFKLLLTTASLALLFGVTSNQPAVAEESTFSKLKDAIDISSGAAWERRKKEEEENTKRVMAEVEAEKIRNRPAMTPELEEANKKFAEANQPTALKQAWEEAQKKTVMAQVTGKPDAEVAELQKDSEAKWDAFCGDLKSRGLKKEC